MATVTWTLNGDDNWNVPANWSTAAVPANGDDVLIGHNTVNLTDSYTVNSISITGSNTALVVQNAIDAVTANVSNAGTLQIDRNGPGGSVFVIGGTLSNSHELQIGNLGLGNAVTVTA